MNAQAASATNEAVHTPLSASATPAGRAITTPAAKPVLASPSARPRRSGGASRVTTAAPTLMNTGNAAPCRTRIVIITAKVGHATATRLVSANSSSVAIMIRRGGCAATASVRGGPSSEADNAKAPTRWPALVTETSMSWASRGSRPTTMNSLATTTVVAAASTISVTVSTHGAGAEQELTRWRRRRWSGRRH